MQTISAIRFEFELVVVDVVNKFIEDSFYAKSAIILMSFYPLSRRQMHRRREKTYLKITKRDSIRADAFRLFVICSLSRTPQRSLFFVAVCMYYVRFCDTRMWFFFRCSFEIRRMFYDRVQAATAHKFRINWWAFKWIHNGHWTWLYFAFVFVAASQRCKDVVIVSFLRARFTRQNQTFRNSLFSFCRHHRRSRSLSRQRNKKEI